MSDGAADPVTGEAAPPEAPCVNERGHWRHPWLDAAEPPGVGVVQRRCPGRPAVTAAFADHRYVDVVRCYQMDGDGPCRRMLVIEQPDGFAEPGSAFGWTLREWGGGAVGAGEREWRCPRHSAGAQRTSDG